MRNNPELRRQMFEMIEDWQESGLTKKAYCQQQSIKHHSFYYWYKCYRTEHGNADNDSGGFAKLKIDKSVIAASVEIYFPGGVRLLFHEQVSSSYLKAIIS
jgi:transposase-like protein